MAESVQNIFLSAAKFESMTNRYHFVIHRCKSFDYLFNYWMYLLRLRINSIIYVDNSLFNLVLGGGCNTYLQIPVYSVNVKLIQNANGFVPLAKAALKIHSPKSHFIAPNSNLSSLNLTNCYPSHSNQSPKRKSMKTRNYKFIEKPWCAKLNFIK